AAVLPTNLLSLQNLLKRDPPSYKEEFLQQLNHYTTTLEIFKQSPAQPNHKFGELITFIAQVSICFPAETAVFPDDLAYLLTKHHAVLDPDLREKIVQNLVLLRNKGVISSISLIKTFIPILSASNSKALRAQIYEAILSAIKTENAKAKNASLNKTVQSILFDMVNHESSGVWAIRLTKELWAKNIWSGDARVAEICKIAALSLHTKVMLGGLYFFMGVEQEEEDSDEEGPDLRQMQHAAGVNKTSKARAQKVRKAIVAENKRKKQPKQGSVNFSALQILHDPQSFAEKLYSVHLASKRPLSFDHKMLVMALLSRLLGYHKLTVLPFYSFLSKWISPHQRDVTKILASLAGAVHEFVPPEIISPSIKKIANEFVTTGVSPEVVCAGLNSIREICSRNPLAMDETLLQDLTEYKGSKDKGVMMASRSLITLYRDVAPEMLAKKDRGKSASIGLAAGTSEGTQFGVERNVTRGIDGLELLEEHYAHEEPEDAWDDFEVESEEDEADGGWINVESDGEIDFSSDDDEEKEKPVPVPKPVGESIASQRILTPADFKKLAELRAAAPGKQTHHSLSVKRKEDEDDFIDAAQIEGPRKRIKADREGRMATVLEGREGREKFGSRKGGRTEEGRSTTNKEKARKKNFLMVKHRKDIQGKSMKKLTIKRKELKAHIERGKR
ncbi:SDA1-domain-containing protein, partial [Protomyces lactucae-debilis]